MVFPSPRSGHNLKSLHKKGIIPLFGWYCPFWASYLFKAASGWPRGRFLHYKRCSTPAGSVQRFQASAPAFLPLWALLLFLQHSFPIVSAGLADLYAVFTRSVMKLYCQAIKKPSAGRFWGCSFCGGLAMVLEVIFPAGRALMQGRTPSSAWGVWLQQLTGA